MAIFTYLHKILQYPVPYVVDYIYIYIYIYVHRDGIETLNDGKWMPELKILLHRILFIWFLIKQPHVFSMWKTSVSATI